MPETVERTIVSHHLEADGLNLDVNAQQQTDHDIDVWQVEAAVAKEVAKRDFRRLVTVHVVISKPQRVGISKYWADDKSVLDRKPAPPGDHMPSTAGNCRSQSFGAQENHLLQTMLARRASSSWCFPPIGDVAHLQGVAFAYLGLYSYTVAYALASLETMTR